MAFVLGFLAFLICQNTVLASILNLTETSNDQNVSSNCTDLERFGGNCTFLPEEIETSLENQTSFDDVLTNSGDESLNLTEIPRLNNFTIEEESIWSSTNSSDVPKIDKNATDPVITGDTSFQIPEQYNRSVEDTTDLNFTSGEENPRDSHTKTPAPPKNVLVLKSNCSVENSELSSSSQVTNVGCTVYLDLNYVAQNDSEASIAKLIQELKPLSIKSGEFDIVESYEIKKIPVNEDKIPTSFFDRETFAYLAVACSFAIVLLIACIIFGLRCLRKKKPTFDISRFDVKLSDYTLTRIPRASLSSTEYLHNPKLLERPKYSTVPRESYGPVKCSNGGEHSMGESLQDRFPSTREFKTFKSGRVVELSANHVDNGINFNATAYENPTFHRYF